MPTAFPKLLTAFQYLLIGFLFITKSYSQNLVPNHDFNFHSQCPDDRGLLKRAHPWYSPNYTTTDFSHTCAGANSTTGIPQNRWGHQAPHSGNGYAGIRTWLQRGNTGTGINYREYLAVGLTDSLIAGETYLLSFKLSVADKAGFFTDDIGLYVSHDSLPETVVIDVEPHLANPQGNFLKEMGSWVELSGNYVAEGGEKFIAIGNFRNDDETTVIERDSNSVDNFLQSTYFYIDDVRVERCAGYFPQYLITASDTNICPGDLSLLSVPQIKDAMYRWEDGTTDNVREVNAAQSYSITIDVNGCIRSDTLEILSKTGVQLSLGADTTLCPGESLTLTFDENVDSFIWNNQVSHHTLHIQSEGLYTLQVTKNDCITNDSIYVYYAEELPSITSIDTVKCHSESILLEAAVDSISYLWQDLSSEATFLAQNAGEYWVDMLSQCEMKRQYFYISDEACSCESFVQNVFSPNADGINDIFKPQFSQGGISKYQLEVFDRFGRLMFSSRDISEPWTGRYQQKIAAEGVYFWVLKYDCKEGGLVKQQISKGHISLLR